jgi:hypothetical protein
MKPQQPSRQFNLAFRPATYWPESTGTKAFVGRIKGTTRRRLAHEAITGGLSGAPDLIFDASLDDRARAALGRVHPTLMGGEYLPDLAPGEVEIARIELASTTADVIAVFARREGDHIRYRLVDEYQDLLYDFSPERSDEPLSLGELVGLLDHACAYEGPPRDCSIREGRRFATIEAAYIAAAESPALMRALVWMEKYRWEDATRRAYGLIEGFWEFLFRKGDPPEQAAAFVSLSSPLYPALTAYYQRRAQDWIAVSRRNPLPPEVVVALEEGWRQATPDQRTAIAEFLRSHGYERGWFRKYGARDVEHVPSLLAD